MVTMNRRKFLRNAVITAGVTVILPQVSAMHRYIQPDDLSTDFPSVITRPDPINLNPVSDSHLTFNPLDPFDPKFTSLADVKMDDAAVVIGEWAPYTVPAGSEMYKSKVFAYMKRVKPLDTNSTSKDVELDILIDNVLRRDVYYCLDTIDYYSDTRNLRTIRADTGLENSTPYAQPTDWHRIIQIWSDERGKKYTRVPHSEKTHPITTCFQKGDYVDIWENIKKCFNPGNISWTNADRVKNVEAISFYGISPNNTEYEHWIAGLRIPNANWGYNPDDIPSLPFNLEIGFLPYAVTAENLPEMDGQWSEILRRTYTPPWTPAGIQNDKRTWPDLIQTYA